MALAGFDQRSDDGVVLSAAVGACAERIFPGEGDRTHGAFDFASSNSIEPNPPAASVLPLSGTVAAADYWF